MIKDLKLVDIWLAFALTGITIGVSILLLYSLIAGIAFAIGTYGISQTAIFAGLGLIVFSVIFWIYYRSLRKTFGND